MGEWHMTRLLAVLCVVTVGSCDRLTAPSDYSPGSDEVSPIVRHEPGPASAPGGATVHSAMPRTDREIMWWSDTILCVP